MWGNPWRFESSPWHQAMEGQALQGSLPFEALAKEGSPFVRTYCKLMNSTIQKQEDGTITLTITIPAKDVLKQKEEAILTISQDAKVPGFRKGMAPKKVVEERVSNESVREEVIQQLIPKAYAEAIKTHNLKPIINPHLHVEKSNDGEDLTFVAQLCEAPKIDLGNYKEEVRKATAKSKIIIPGKDKPGVGFDEIAQALLGAVKVTVPKIIIEQETQKLLAQTLDEVKRLGLTLEQYLSSTGRNVEALRHEYEEKAGRDIALEFSLQKIAEVEGITVEEKEIEEAIVKAKDEEERKALSTNRYLLAQILRQQKTLDFIKNL